MKYNSVTRRTRKPITIAILTVDNVVYNIYAQLLTVEETMSVLFQQSRTTLI
jgi:hypothetical protein